MEYKLTPITVDQPFMEQQAFRDFLKLPSEEAATKIEFKTLLEVIKLVIKDKLFSCGYSENELVEIEIKYKNLQNESQEYREVYSVGWSCLPQIEKTTNDKDEAFNEQPEINIDENDPRLTKFVSNLTQRLDEIAALETATITAANINFRTLGSSGCIYDVCYEGFLAKFCNGEFDSWQTNGLDKIPCPKPDEQPIFEG